MKKTIKLLTVILCVSMCLTAFLGIPASAQGARVSVSRSSVNVGETVTVTCSFQADSGMYYYVGTLTYDTTVFQCISGDGTASSGAVKVVGELSGETSYTFSDTFMAISAGQGNFSFTGDGSGTERTVLSSSNSVSVTTPAPPTPPPGPTPIPTPDPTPEQPSSDADLLSINVSGAELSPAYSKSVTNYTATVKYSVDKATISVTAPNGATFVGAGTFDLEVGNNNHTITVTAADRKTKKSYSVNIRRMTAEETKQAEENAKSENPLIVKIGGKELNITPDLSPLGVFEGYTLEKTKRGETEVNYLTDSKGKYKLYYMTDADGKGEYYNEFTDNCFESVDYIISGVRLYIVNSLPKNTDVARGYRKAVLNLNGKKMPAVQFNDEAAKDIYIVYCYYGGKNGYYRYDAAEKTVSRAPEFEGTLIKTTSGRIKIPGFIEKFRNMSTAGKAIIILIALAAIGIVTIIVLAIVTVTKNRKVKKKMGKGKFYPEDAPKQNDIEITDTESIDDAKYD